MIDAPVLESIDSWRSGHLAGITWLEPKIEDFREEVVIHYNEFNTRVTLRPFEALSSHFPRLFIQTRVEQSAPNIVWSHRRTAVEWGEVFLQKAFESLDWVKYLAEEDQAVMRTELATLLQTAATTGEWQSYQRALRAWQSTAEVVSDPELVADLLAPWDPAEAIEITRP